MTVPCTCILILRMTNNSQTCRPSYTVYVRLGIWCCTIWNLVEWRGDNRLGMPKFETIHCIVYNVSQSERTILQLCIDVVLGNTINITPVWYLIGIVIPTCTSPSIDCGLNKVVHYTFRHQNIKLATQSNWAEVLVSPLNTLLVL